MWLLVFDITHTGVVNYDNDDINEVDNDDENDDIDDYVDDDDDNDAVSDGWACAYVVTVSNEGKQFYISAVATHANPHQSVKKTLTSQTVHTHSPYIFTGQYKRRYNIHIYYT